MTSTRGALTMLLLVVPAAACSGEARGPGDDVTVRDSAGVRIVESARPEARWGLEPEPRVIVGRAEGEAAYLLSNVGDAAFLPDGGIALLDGGSRELRLYGPDGAFRDAFGGEGEGPGEFRSLGAPLIVEPEGGFLLWDPRLRRITRVSADLTRAETVIPEPVDGASGMVLRGRFGDGTLVLSPVGSGPPPASGRYRATLDLHRADAGARPLNALVSLPAAGGEIRVSGGPDPASITSIEILRTPMGTEAHHATADSLLLAGSSARFEVRAVAPDGALRWLARPALTRRPLDDGIRERFIEARAAEAPSPEAVRRAYGEVAFPDSLPAFDGLVVGEEGRLWMRAYRAFLDEGPVEWYVFDTGGAWIATAELPAALRVTRITRDRLLGVFEDALGVESVRIYRIVR